MSFRSREYERALREANKVFQRPVWNQYSVPEDRRASVYGVLFFLTIMIITY